MSTLGSTQSHLRDLVAQLAADSEQAEALFRLLVLADSSTPKGAAMRTEAIKQAFFYTHECDDAVRQAAEKVAA